MKTLTLFSLLCLFSSSFAQNVSGNLKDALFNSAIPNVSVTLKNHLSNLTLGTDTTDSNGNFNIDYIINSVNQSAIVPSDFYLSKPYPNPFNPSARIDFSSPVTDNFNVSIYNIIGQLVYRKDFQVQAGNYSFTISGLSSAGVYIFNISNNKFNSTEKLVVLDGSRTENINVELNSQSSSLIGKENNIELRLEFRRGDYQSKDTVIGYQYNLTVNSLLHQVPKQDTINFFTRQNLIPTNTPGNNANITGMNSLTVLFYGVTNNNGELLKDFVVNYVEDPLNPSNRIYTPSNISVSAMRNNTTYKIKEFQIDGSDIVWLNDLQQTLIIRTGVASGNVRNQFNQSIAGANIKLYNNDNNQLFGQNQTNTTGDFQIIYSYTGYENDPDNVFTPINSLRLEGSAPNHNLNAIINNFQSPWTTNLVLEKLPFVVNATIKLYNTKNDVITDLDSIKLTWPDGSFDMYPNNNGTVIINKALYFLNSDTTAIINHNRPELYLKWFMGTTNNPDKVELIYQNPGPGQYTPAKVPLNKINNITTELYLIPKQARYGPNNDWLIDMDGPTVSEFLERSPSYVVSGFRTTPQYDSIYILKFTFNEVTNEPIPQHELNRRDVELNKFLAAVDAWLPRKKILDYYTFIINSTSDPLYQYIYNGPRNKENVTLTAFSNYGPINLVSLSPNGLRIKNSESLYTVNSTNGQIQMEIFDSMLNTSIDGPDYVLCADLPGIPYTDLAKNLIGISLIMKPGTRYFR